MKKLRILTILTLTALSLANLPAPAQNSNKEKLLPVITKQADILLKQEGITSVSIGIVWKGEKIKYYAGELTRGQGNRPSDQTLFEIASVTKTMTGLLTAIAEAEGKINLNDDIVDYLGSGYSNLSFQGQPITIRHLLTHTAGLPFMLPEELGKVFNHYEPKDADTFYEIQKKTNKKVFLNELKKVKIKEVPGLIYNYSNVGSEIMAIILAKVYGQDFESLLQEKIFIPNQMTSTGLTLSEEQEALLAKGIWMSNKSFSPPYLHTYWGGGAGIKSSIPDMMKFIELQLDRHNLVVRKSHKLLYEENNTLKLAYFWRVWIDKYGVSYNHHGGTTGTQNWIYIYPQYDFGISIITNYSSPKVPGKLTKAVRNILKEVESNE